LISGVTIDYDPPPFVYGLITSLIGKPTEASPEVTVTITLAEKSTTPEDFVAQYPSHDLWPPIVVFDAKTRAMRCRPCGWGQTPLGKKVKDRV